MANEERSKFSLAERRQAFKVVQDVATRCKCSRDWDDRKTSQCKLHQTLLEVPDAVSRVIEVFDGQNGAIDRLQIQRATLLLSLRP